MIGIKLHSQKSLKIGDERLNNQDNIFVAEVSQLRQKILETEKLVV